MADNDTRCSFWTWVTIIVLLTVIAVFGMCPKSHGVENPYQGLNIHDIPEKIDQREVLERRTDNSFTIDNGDGTYTGFFYGSQIFNVPADEKQNLIARLFSVVVSDATATTTNYYGPGGSNGYITGASVDYNLSTGARQASDTCWTTTGTYPYIGQRYVGGVGYQCYRAYLSFTTSALDGYTVSQANVYMKAYTDNSDTDFDIRLMHHNWTEVLCSNTETNYDACLSASTYTLWKSTSTWSSGTYYASSNITTSWVDTDGTTYFSVISSRDDAGTTPTGNEFVQIYGVPAPLTTSDPYLAVVYSDATAPTPNPATFSTAPYGYSTTEIRMTSTTGSDLGTVSYQFVGSDADVNACNSGGGESSQTWSTTKTFADGGLAANNEYSYTIQMRDGVPNTGTASSATYAYTLIEAVAALTIGTTNSDSIYVKTGTSLTNISCGSSGVRYACSPKADTSAWIQNANDYVFSGLEVDSLYTFTGQSRNGDGVVTAYGGSTNKRTLAVKPGTPVLSDVTASSIDVNPDKGANQTYTDLAIKVTYGATVAWVQANGTLGGTTDTVWAVDETWGDKTVTGLTAATEYTFGVVARNGDDLPTAVSTTAAETTLSEGVAATQVKHMSSFYLRFMDDGSDSTTIQFMKD